MTTLVSKAASSPMKRIRSLFPRLQSYSTSLRREPAALETSHGPSTTYQWQEDVEDLDGYVAGGYHPVHIGDKYKSERYEIVHKLGFGSHSTVWLAQDRRDSRFVALKFLVADAYDTTSEANILSR